ncbi:MAG: hypothetical protein Kow0059_15590 [Candidatus Sumerlaeia bacterium]
MTAHLIRRFLSPAMLLSAALAGLIGSAGAASPAEPQHIVSVSSLRERLNDPGLRIVDVREKTSDYWAGHVPGAVYLHPEALRWPRAGVPAALMPPDALAMLLGEMGIGPDASIIIYGEDTRSTPPYYLAAALDGLGHADFAVLEGGWAAWRSAGAPITTQYPAVRPVKYEPSSKPSGRVFSTEAEVKQALAGGTALVLDVRPDDQFEGRRSSFARAGHIAGAGHLDIGALAGGDRWDSIENLQAAFRRAGGTPGKPVIVYCNTGRSAAQAWFALRHLAGLKDVTIYNGSFNEWVNDPANPVATGQAPAAPAPAPAQSPAQAQSASAPAAGTSAGELKIGDQAPDFTLEDQDARLVSLADFRGKWVVLYFYPKADTPGCTKEACSFSENILYFQDSDAVVLGVSGDDVEAQKAFAEKFGLKIRLLADPEGKVLSAYGVGGRTGQFQGRPFIFARRTTFLINPEGKIAHIWPQVEVAGHADDVRNRLVELKQRR